MHIHSPFTGGFKSDFLKSQMKRHAMHVPVVSPARAATVATHAWTKLHAQIMS